MDELKIYIEHKDFEGEKGAVPIADVIDNANQCALLMSKYRIMWMFRKIEKEFIESNGFIVLDMGENNETLRVRGYNFPFKMELALRFVIPDIILLDRRD